MWIMNAYDKNSRTLVEGSFGQEHNLGIFFLGLQFIKVTQMPLYLFNRYLIKKIII
jgi:hypothetical protein